MTGRSRACLAALIASLTLFSSGLAAAEPGTVSTLPPVPASSAPSVPSVEPSTPAPRVSSPPPSSVAPSAPPDIAARPGVEVTVAFDKASYHTGELIKIDFTIKNATTERLVGLYAFDTRLDLPDAMLFDPNQWAEFSTGRGGVTLEPGAAHTVKLAGRISRSVSEAVTLTGFVFDHTGMGAAQFSASAPVTRTYGHASGIVFSDKNNNGRFEAGEELPHANVSWAYAENWSDETRYTTTTDAGGRFTFVDIPTVRYRTENLESNGWVQLFYFIEVDQSDKNDDLRIRAVKPLNGELKVDMKFTKRTYQRGELAHLTVKLTNSGPVPLTGIVANCNRVGNGDILEGTGPGWGDLAIRFWGYPEKGIGVTVPAGQTLTLDVTDTVPDAAFKTGSVRASCDFGYSGFDDAFNHPGAGDEADVPGGLGGIEGRVVYYPEGPGYGKPEEPVAGVKVVLVSKRSCRLGETVSDEKGIFKFSNVPASWDHFLYLYPPAGWVIKGENPEPNTWVRDGEIMHPGVEAGKGEGQLPALPAPSAECGQAQPAPPPPGHLPAGDRQPPAGGPGGGPGGGDSPAPQAKAVATLANTGANVMELAAVGVITLLLGVAALLASRRRRGAAG